MSSNISKQLDYFATKYYTVIKNIKRRIKMTQFFNNENIVSRIDLVMYVKPGTGNAIHHNRPNHGLALNCDGIKEYIFSDKKVIVEKNEIIYLPKYSDYDVSAFENGGCYAINFDFTDDCTFDSFVFKPKNIMNFTDCFKTAERCWKMKKSGFYSKTMSELYNIISMMQQQNSAEYISKNKSEIIKPALDYIHTNYTTEQINMQQLSSMCQISYEYFRRLFENFYGISPVKYVNNLKITRAKELIESGMYSVTEAAFASGYTDMSHFCREFKKSTGFAPSRYGK